MTQDEIIEMARQAGFERVIDINPHTGIKTIEAYATDSLERFAKLVAAKEREACAKVCGRLADEALVVGDEDAVMCFEDAEDAIRARGKA